MAGQSIQSSERLLTGTDCYPPILPIPFELLDGFLNYRRRILCASRREVPYPVRNVLPQQVGLLTSNYAVQHFANLAHGGGISGLAFP